MVHKQAAMLACALALVTSCGSDAKKQPTQEKPAIPAKVTGQYQLASSAHAQPIATRFYIRANEVEVAVASIPDAPAKDTPVSAPNGDPVQLEDLAARVDLLTSGNAPAQASQSAEPEKREPDTEPDDEAGGTGTKMALDDGPDDEAGGTGTKMALDDGPSRAEAVAASARKVAKRDPIHARFDDGTVAVLKSSADFSSGLDDGMVLRGELDRAGPDKKLIGLPIGPHAPLILVDQNTSANRLIEVVGSLCEHGARLGVARKGDPGAAEHTIKLGALRNPACAKRRAGAKVDPAPGEPHRPTVLRLLESGYDLHADNEPVKLESADAAGLASALTGLRSGANGPLELWIAPGKASKVSDLVLALDAAADANLDRVHLVKAKELPKPSKKRGRSSAKRDRRDDVIAELRMGKVETTGDLTDVAVRRVVRFKIPRLKYCYQKRLDADPELAGTVVAKFEISPEGKVTSAVAEGVSAAVSDCIAAVIQPATFPEASTGEPTRVQMSFELSSGSR